jgi:hypothetical protein
MIRFKSAIKKIIFQTVLKKLDITHANMNQDTDFIPCRKWLIDQKKVQNYKKFRK